MVFLLARLLSIPTYRQAGIKHPLRRTCPPAGSFAVVRYLSIWEIQKPLFSMGLNGCKDNTLINSTFLCYPLNFGIHNS